LLHFPDEIEFGFLDGLEEEAVAVVGLAVAEEDESQLVAGVVEQLLLQGQFAALQRHLGTTAPVRKGLVHRTPRVHH
jgi:hypothetical protein